MLRASSQATEQDFNYEAIMQGNAADSGVAGGEALVAYTEAVVARDPERIATASEQLRSELGDDALVDAAGVAANFHRMTRIADGTGIPLDDHMSQVSEDLRAALGIDVFRHAPEVAQ